MSNYAAAAKPPRVLPERETKALLRVSGEHARGFRDHVIFSLAVGAGLREHEITALNIGDVSDDGRHVRRAIVLRVFKGHRRAREPQRVILSDASRRKLQKYLASIRQRPLFLVEEPLFFSRGGRRRLSTRRVREIFAKWAAAAGIDPRYSFHSLRHRYCTDVYRESGKDLAQVMRLARHSRVETSMVYTHPTEEDLVATARKVQG